MNLTVAEYAEKCNTSKQTIYDWHNAGLLSFETELRAGNDTFVIDPAKYPIKSFKVRQRGRKRKNAA